MNFKSSWVRMENHYAILNYGENINFNVRWDGFKGDLQNIKHQNEPLKTYPKIFY